MPQDNSKLSPAIPLKNTGLMKVGNTIQITNKILKEHSKRQLATKFKSVVIGTQEWMTENLSVEFFRNGEPIPEAKTNEEWTKAGRSGQPAWCYYENDPAKEEIYGKLYNWYAVHDKRKIAPEGWFVPASKEWEILIKYLITKGFNYDGTPSNGIAKSLASSTMWKEDLTRIGAIGNDLAKNNKTGFTALPGGYRHSNGTYKSAGSHGCWWSSESFEREYGDVLSQYLGNMNTNNDSWCRYMDYNNSSLGGYFWYRDTGFSVRCLKE